LAGIAKSRSGVVIRVLIRAPELVLRAHIDTALSLLRNARVARESAFRPRRRASRIAYPRRSHVYAARRFGYKRSDEKFAQDRASVTAEPSLSTPTVIGAPSTIERGMLMIAASALTAPGAHAMAKSLGDTMSPGQTSCARFLLQLVLLLPFIWASYRGAFSWPSLAHVVRGGLVAATSMSFIWALNFMPIANCAAIFFVEPLLLTAISSLFLGEQIGWRRTSAVAVGFIGALIVIRPSFEMAGAAALLPLLSALCFALYLAITRHQAPRETALAAQVWICVFSAIALAVAIAIGSQASVAVLQASMPSWWEAFLLSCMAVIALVTQRLAIHAFRLAPASILAPFQYLEILGSIALGALVFGDLPDALTILGTTIIIGSGLYVFRRERMLTQRKRAERVRAAA
jgi:drug/metabolite transporter (DMT)-like permease